MLLMVALIAQGCFFVSALLIAARATVNRKSILRGTLWFYGLSVAGVLLFCVVIPSLLVLLGVDRHTVVHSFPESIVGMPVLLGGWALGLAFATLVRATHALIDRYRKGVNEAPKNAG